MELSEIEDEIACGKMTPYQVFTQMKQLINGGRKENKQIAALAHRACHSAEHDPLNGRIHGFCVPCGVPWPCETANTFIFKEEKVCPICESPLEENGACSDVGSNSCQYQR